MDCEDSTNISFNLDLELMLGRYDTSSDSADLMIAPTCGVLVLDAKQVTTVAGLI